MTSHFIVLVASLLALALSACGGGPSPAPTPAPTPVVTPLGSPVATATAGVQISPTHTLVPPSPIPSPTATATEMPTPPLTATHTRLPQAPTPTPAPPAIPAFPPVWPHVLRLFALPGTPPVLLVLMSDGRLVRSDDGGSTWADLPTVSIGARSVFGIGVDYRNPRTYYLTSDRGIYRSIDQGQTWSLVNTMIAQGITVDFSDPQTLWTGASRSRDVEIQRSTDGGQAWAAASTGFSGYQLAGPILIDPEDSNTMFVVSNGLRGGQSVFRGTRDGAWKALPNPGLMGPCCFAGIGLVWSGSSKTLYLGSFGGKLFASSNAKDPDEQKVVWSVVADFGPLTIVSALAHSEPGETLYISVYDVSTGKNRLLRSPDGGAGWQDLKVP